MSNNSKGDDKTIEHEKVKLLFDYTKFHIGLYTTLGTIVVGILNLKFAETEKLKFRPSLLWASVFLIALAGFAGGIVASTLPHCSTMDDFWKKRTGPFCSKLFTGEGWTYLELTAFWYG